MNPFALLAPLFLAAPALPQDTAVDPKCATMRVAIPPEFAGWSERIPVTAGGAPRTAPVLTVGRATDLTLLATEEFTPVVQPGKMADVHTSGGIAMFQVTHAGTYRVALGSGAWIEVIQARKSLTSTAHGHGPMCTGIRKIVDFRLKPGRYVLQLSGSPTPVIPVLIVHAPAARHGA